MAKLEELKELVQVVNRNKVKNIQIIGNPGSHLTILDQFYEALCDDKFENDEGYCQFLYGQKSQTTAYYKLKDRLFDRTINSLFFIDNSKDLYPISTAFYECHRNVIAVQLLFSKAARKAGASLAEKTIKKSLQYTFTNISLELAKLLRMYYGSLIIDRAKFKYYDKLINKLFKHYKAEIRAQKYLEKIQSHYIESNALKINLLPKFHKYYKKVNKIRIKYTTYKTLVSSFLVSLFYYEIQNDWNKLSELCDEIIQYLDENPKFLNLLLITSVYARKVETSIFLRRFKSGEEYAIAASEQVPKTNLIWFRIQNLHFILLIHSGQFEKAKRLYEQNVGDKSIFSFQPNLEILKIHEAFIHYLLRIGKIQQGPEDKALKPFRLGKFLNEVPIYSKDKRGSNITILILQILFLLEDKKYDAIIDRAESLKSYSHRYLKEDETYRSNCFIKMLLTLPAVGFQKEKVVKNAQKYVDLLEAVPIDKAQQSPEVEVIPYEMLWKFVLESLDRQ